MCNCHFPSLSALPIKEVPNTPGKASGKRVMMSARHTPIKSGASSRSARGFKLACIDLRPWDGFVFLIVDPLVDRPQCDQRLNQLSVQLFL